MRLIDAEVIIEVMKKCAENPENAQALLCYRYTQRILEEAPTVEPVSKWHRVGEEQPKRNEYVLCRIPAFFKGDEPTYEVCQYYKGSRMYGDFIQEDKCTGDVIYQNPSHWMPIEPPEE